jgi:hypothetical protein
LMQKRAGVDAASQHGPTEPACLSAVLLHASWRPAA